MATREDLERRLARLEGNMPDMRRQYPNAGDFISAFAVYADGIVDDAGDADVNWTFRQIDGLLEKYGFSGDSEKPSTGEKQPVTRETLQQRLDAFEAQLALLPTDAQNDAHLRATLNTFADELIADITEDADQDWVLLELNAMLTSHGLSKVDYEPPGPL